MALTASDIAILRSSTYLCDLYTPASGDVPASGLSYFNRTLERNFIEDDALQIKADAMSVEWAYQLASVYAAELDWRKATGTSVVPYLTTAQGGSRDLTFTAKNPTDDITVSYIVSGASTALSVVVTGKDIAIHVATTSGSAADSTASQIKAATDASPAAFALVTTALALGNDGTGKPAAMATTNLVSDAVRAAIALQQDCLFRLIRASVFEAMTAGSGFVEVLPVDARAGEVTAMQARITADRQFVKDKTAQGRRRVAAGG